MIRHAWMLGFAFGQALSPVGPRVEALAYLTLFCEFERQLEWLCIYSLIHRLPCGRLAYHRYNFDITYIQPDDRRFLLCNRCGHRLYV